MKFHVAGSVKGQTWRVDINCVTLLIYAFNACAYVHHYRLFLSTASATVMHERRAIRGVLSRRGIDCLSNQLRRARTSHARAHV